MSLLAISTGSRLAGPALGSESVVKPSAEWVCPQGPWMAAGTDAGPPGAHHCPHYGIEVSVRHSCTHLWKEPIWQTPFQPWAGDE